MPSNLHFLNTIRYYADIYRQETDKNEFLRAVKEEILILKKLVKVLVDAIKIFKDNASK